MRNHGATIDYPPLPWRLPDRGLARRHLPVLPQRHYPSHEAYLFAIADAVRHECDAVVRAGLLLQVDCPDLAMGRHIQCAALSLEELASLAEGARLASREFWL